MDSSQQARRSSGNTCLNETTHNYLAQYILDRLFSYGLRRSHCRSNNSDAHTCKCSWKYIETAKLLSLIQEALPRYCRGWGGVHSLSLAGLRLSRDSLCISQNWTPTHFVAEYYRIAWRCISPRQGGVYSVSCMDVIV